MLLYLFYNSDLLTDIGRTEMKVGYMDDVNFFAEGPTLDDAYAALGDMMMHNGGGLDWSRNHNSKFEMSKLTLVGFSPPTRTRPGTPRQDDHGAVAQPLPR